MEKQIDLFLHVAGFDFLNIFMSMNMWIGRLNILECQSLSDWCIDPRLFDLNSKQLFGCWFFEETDMQNLKFMCESKGPQI